MAEPFYTCCEDGMLSQVPPTDRSGLCPACQPSGKLRRLSDEELAQELRVPGTLTWGQCRNMAEALRAQGVVAYGVPESGHQPSCAQTPPVSRNPQE